MKYDSGLNPDDKSGNSCYSCYGFLTKGLVPKKSSSHIQPTKTNSGDDPIWCNHLGSSMWTEDMAKKRVPPLSNNGITVTNHSSGGEGGASRSSQLPFRDDRGHRNSASARSADARVMQQSWMPSTSSGEQDKSTQRKVKREVAAKGSFDEISVAALELTEQPSIDAAATVGTLVTKKVYTSSKKYAETSLPMFRDYFERFPENYIAGMKKGVKFMATNAEELRKKVLELLK